MDLKNTFNRILLIGIGVLAILLMISNCKNTRLQEKMYEEQQAMNKKIVEMDSTTKEKDGQYAKLVNIYNTERDLIKQLRDENKDLSKLIKDQNERLLMINNTVISLQSQIDNGFGQFNPEDSSLIDLELKYPNDTDWFISWDGSIHTGTAHYNGEWKFGKLPLQVVMTETERGIWKSRLIGPDWLLVDSIDVNSIPPEDMGNKPELRNLGFVLGGGYIHSFDKNMTPSAVSLGGGLYFKNHSIILNGTTNRTVGLSYYYRFKSFKKK
jgi:hypothetical protein